MVGKASKQSGAKAGGREKPTRVSRRRWSAVLFTLLVALVLLEVLSRIFVVHVAGAESFRRYASLAQLQSRYGSGLQGIRDADSLFSFRHHRYLGYSPTPGFRRGPNRHNSRGYRGDEIVLPKPPGEFRIVCLGGSTTYTAGVEDYRQSYPRLLEEELQQAGYDRVSVINGGVPGWSSWETLINFELRVLDLEPDLIVVTHAINDINARLVWPPESYRGDNSGQRKPGAEGLFMPSLLEHSTLARFFLVRAGIILPHSALQRSVDPPADSYQGDLFLEQRIRGSYPSGVFAETRAAQMLQRNRPVYFRRNLTSLLAVARRSGIEPVLTTFPYSSRFDRAPRTSTEEYIAAYAEMDRVMREVAVANAVHLIDLATTMGQDPRFYRDGHHVNEEGARRKARIVAQGLIEAGVLPR